LNVKYGRQSKKLGIRKKFNQKSHKSAGRLGEAGVVGKKCGEPSTVKGNKPPPLGHYRRGDPQFSNWRRRGNSGGPDQEGEEVTGKKKPTWCFRQMYIMKKGMGVNKKGEDVSDVRKATTARKGKRFLK